MNSPVKSTPKPKLNVTKGLRTTVKCPQPTNGNLSFNSHMYSDMKAHFLFWVFMTLGGLVYGQSLSSDAVVIGNETGFNSLSEKQVRTVMRGESTRWRGGSGLSVTVVFPSVRLPECSKTAQFVVNSSRAATLQKYWLGLVFEGRAKAPIFGQTQEDVLEAVMSKPGAIGIVYGMEVPAQYVIQVTAE